MLYKRTSFYHINSAQIIDTCYSLRIDYDKLDTAYSITKVLMQAMCEAEEAKEALSLFLNTMYVIENKDIPAKFVEAIFKLKLISLLGYMPNIITCKKCETQVIESEAKEYFYSFVDNNIICSACYEEEIRNGKSY